jgi:hypothetical protein
VRESQAIAVLMKVKANWYRQPADELTRAEWVECLTPLEYKDAVAAVTRFRESREEPPTPGMVARSASDIEQRRLENRRSLQRKLVTVPSIEERARMKKQLHDLVEMLGAKAKDARLRG